MIVTYDSVKSNLEHGTDTYNKVTYGLLPVDEGLLREDEEDDLLSLSLAETVFGWFGGKTRQLEREADRRRAAADAHADGDRVRAHRGSPCRRARCRCRRAGCCGRANLERMGKRAARAQRAQAHVALLHRSHC